MKKSKRQAGSRDPRDVEFSKRFEARVKKSLKRRKLEKQGRKAARRK